jgi:hypothetical protein
VFLELILFDIRRLVGDDAIPEYSRKAESRTTESTLGGASRIVTMTATKVKITGIWKGTLEQSICLHIKLRYKCRGREYELHNAA